MATKKARAARKSSATKSRGAKSAAPRKRATRKAPAKTPARKSAKRPAAAAIKRTSATTSATRGARKTAAAKPKMASPRAEPRKSAPAARERRAPAQAASATSVFPCGDEALRTATGKGWDEWLKLLDSAGAAAKSLDHQAIWNIAMRSLPASADWWGQMVSVGYERARGLRVRHQTSAGDFQATVSKTLPVPLFAAFAAWADQNLRRSWLEAPDLDFTRLNAGKNIRARWPNGSMLDIRFNASGPDKCQIVIDTMKLPSAEAVQEAKTFWQGQLERLRTYFRV